jgi:HprK-related kinase B
MNQVVNFINNRHIQWALCRGCLLGHAAGVIVNGRGLAMAGFSGSGKSTLALHLMSRGAVFVSNDRLMVERNEDAVRMYGVAKLPRINPGTALNNPHLKKIISAEEMERFQAMSEAELWDLEYKYDAPIDELFGPDRFVLQAPMFGLVILNWRRGGGPLKVDKVDLRERRDLLPAFMKSAGLFFTPDGACRSTPPTESSYLDMLSACKVWEMSGGADFDGAARHCLQFCGVEPS